MRATNPTIVMAIVCLLTSWTLAVPVTSGLVLDLDANKINGLDNNPGISNNDPVSTWVNVAPSATDSMTALGTSPTYIRSGFNGKPVVRFNNQEMTDSAASLNITGFGLTIFLLMQQTAVAPDGYMGNYGGSGTGYYMNQNSANFSFFAGSFVNSGAVTSASTLNAPLIVAGVHDASTMRLFVNGTLAGSTTSAAIVSSSAPAAVGNDGRNFPGFGDGFWNGDYRHVLIYNRALDSTELASVHAFMQAEALPEPSTLALLATAGLGLLRRRRQSHFAVATAAAESDNQCELTGAFH